MMAVAEPEDESQVDKLFDLWNEQFLMREQELKEVENKGDS